MNTLFCRNGARGTKPVASATQHTQRCRSVVVMGSSIHVVLCMFVILRTLTRKHVQPPPPRSAVRPDHDSLFDFSMFSSPFPPGSRSRSHTPTSSSMYHKRQRTRPLCSPGLVACCTHPIAPSHAFLQCVDRRRCPLPSQIDSCLFCYSSEKVIHLLSQGVGCSVGVFSNTTPPHISPRGRWPPLSLFRTVE